MKLGRITGKVWATAKDPKLDGLIFYIMQPVNEDDEILGHPLIAIDTVGSKEGDLVFWVGGAEATLDLLTDWVLRGINLFRPGDRKYCFYCETFRFRK